MLELRIWNGRNRKIAASMLAATWALTSATPAMAFACRVTDFTDRAIGSLNEVQRLSFVTEMTNTEYDRIKSEQPGSPDYYKLIADSKNIRDAREAARKKLYSLEIKNIDGYRETWASDFLTDEQLRNFLDCMSRRQPGLMVAGRSVSPSQFNMTFTHMTPIGIRKISTDLVATHNIANVEELDTFLSDIGLQDNYSAKTFPLEIIDPQRRAVVVIQAGWETPKFLYIPAYPTPDYFAKK